MFSEFINTQLGATLMGVVVGIILTTFLSIYFRRRGLCTYSVNHNRAAVSADDPVFGSVRVTWQGNEVGNLYVSTVELRNESINDHENVKVRIYTNNTTLLNERTQIINSPEILSWTEEYNNLVTPNVGNAVSDDQRSIYSHQREYLIPVLNRGEKVHFEYLNISDIADDQPEIWMSIVHKGLVLKFRVPQPEMLGVPHRLASLVGIITCVFLIIPFTYSSTTLTSTAFLSFMLGVFVLVPGALLIKLVAWIKKITIG